MLSLRISIISLLISSSSGFSQNPEDFIATGEKLENYSIKINPDHKLKVVKEINHFIIKEYYSQDWLDIREDLDNFHFIDYDFDKDLDIIFYGFIGGEPQGTIFFENIDNKYNQAFLETGYISEIKLDKESKNLHFKVKEPPCCVDVVEALKVYTVDFKSSERRFTLNHRYHYLTGTKLPDKFIAPAKFRVLNQHYKLRSSPIVDDSPADPDIYYSLGGNVAAIYPKGSNGIAISSYVDSTDRIWWFVIMNDNSSTLQTEIHDMDFDSSFYRCGWMSSRYLEKLE